MRKAFALAASLAVVTGVVGVAQQQALSPDAVSGMYQFLREGEFVQINVDPPLPNAKAEAGEPLPNPVSGYVSRFGENDTDKDSFIDQFFESGSLVGNKLIWKTKRVHGVWYEFSGVLERGPGKKPSDEGMYQLRGTLTQHNDANGTDSARKRDVTLKMFPSEEPE
jgi:hypothetical protein